MLPTSLANEAEKDHSYEKERHQGKNVNSPAPAQHCQNPHDEERQEIQFSGLELIETADKKSEGEGSKPQRANVAERADGKMSLERGNAKQQRGQQTRPIAARQPASDDKDQEACSRARQGSISVIDPPTYA